MRTIIIIFLVRLLIQPFISSTIVTPIINSSAVPNFTSLVNVKATLPTFDFLPVASIDVSSSEFVLKNYRFTKYFASYVKGF